MAEEVRFFLRTALYSAVIAIVYWFASAAYAPFGLEYDWAGTTLLAFTIPACAVVFGGVLLLAGGRRDGSDGARNAGRDGFVGALNRAIGLEHPRPGPAERPLTDGPDAFPVASPWPILAAVAVTLVLLGLIYGPWLIGPGLVLFVVATAGWLRHP